MTYNLPRGLPLQTATFCLLLTSVAAQNPPEIERPPQSQAVKSGGIAAFYCYATGEPAPSFTWKKNGKKLRYTDSRYVAMLFTLIKSAVVNPLPNAQQVPDF